MIPDDIRQIRERANSGIMEIDDILWLCEALEAAQQERRDVGDELAYSVALSAEHEQRADVTEAVMAEVQAENTDLHLVAQGIKHYWRCGRDVAHNQPDDVICQRCLREDAEQALAPVTAERDKWMHVCELAWTAFDGSTRYEIETGLPRAVEVLRERVEAAEDRGDEYQTALAQMTAERDAMKGRGC